MKKNFVASWATELLLQLPASKVVLKINTVKLNYWIVVTGFFSLFFLLLLWHTVLAPSTLYPKSITLLVTVTPLLIHLRGILYGRPRSFAWIAFISLFYMIHGIVEAYASSEDRLYASLEVVSSNMLFWGATYYIRSLKMPKATGNIPPDITET